MTTMIEYGHGLHHLVPEGTYHARVMGLASKHALDLVRRSPAHYRAWVDGAEDRDTDALRFGRAFDCSLLEPERFAVDYVVEPAFGDCRKKENKANRDAWRDVNKGAVWLAKDEHDACLAMARAIRAHSRASRLLIEGTSQVTARWRDESTEIECKARLDYYSPGRRLIVDVKTAENAGYSAFAKAAANYGYHRQAAFYLDGLRSLGAPAEHFVFIVVEKSAPYAVATYMLSAEDLHKGRSTIRDDIETLADRLERDVWDAYPEDIQVLNLPAWAA